MSNGSGAKRRPIPGFGWLPEWIQDFEQPLPGAEWLRDQVRPGSVMDPWAEKQARDFLRALVPQDVHDMALEGLVGMISGPVIGTAGRAVSRKLNPPFNPARRNTLRTLGGKDTLDTIVKRRELTHPDTYFRYQNVSSWLDPKRYKQKHKMENWGKAVRKHSETQSDRGGVLGDIIEHGNIINRKIKEETLKETGEEVLQGGNGEITKDFLESLLRRFGVRK